MNGFCSCGHSEDDHKDVSCGDMIWSQECTKCDFKTTSDDDAITHEHDAMNVIIEITQKQMDRAFGKT